MGEFEFICSLSLIQIRKKAEMEALLKQLEKDCHNKGDTVDSLSRQLEDIKLINFDMYRKLQVRLGTNEDCSTILAFIYVCNIFHTDWFHILVGITHLEFRLSSLDYSFYS